jgi:hypothetical protein
MLKRIAAYIVGRPEAALASCHGLTTDAQGRLYVVDTFQKWVQVFDTEANHYFFFPKDPALFPHPRGLPPHRMERSM